MLWHWTQSLFCSSFYSPQCSGHFHLWYQICWISELRTTVSRPTVCSMYIHGNVVRTSSLVFLVLLTLKVVFVRKCDFWVHFVKNWHYGLSIDLVLNRASLSDEFGTRLCIFLQIGPLIYLSFYNTGSHNEVQVVVALCHIRKSSFYGWVLL